MAKNTSIALGDHFSNFVDDRVAVGRYGSVSEVVRAGLRLLEEEEAKLENLRRVLAAGEAQLDSGESTDGEDFMKELIG